MCSLQNASFANYGMYPSEQLEDDFITNLFSGNIESTNHDCPQTTPVQANPAIENVYQSNSTWRLANQMDHNYATQTESSMLLLPNRGESATLKNSASSVNMSTYFSSFDPSVQFQTDQLQAPVIQHKLNSIQQVMGKMHRARINLVPTANGNFKAIVKRKRKRTVFRTDQVEAMEEVFAKKPYVTKEDRKILVDRLQLSDKSVKVWFQNRRLKYKRGDDYLSEDENRSSPNLDRLDYVESKIYERTNEFGYVTLDDRIMSDLVKVVDDYLSQPNTDGLADIEMEKTTLKQKIVPLYEPISPASTIDNSNEESSWECQSPVENDYLQTLIDIESIISN